MAEVLPREEIERRLAHVPGWTLRGEGIAKEFRLDGGFMGAVGFVNRIATAAEAANHHPDLTISWDRVTVTLSTHDAGGVTGKDTALAAEIDRLAGG